MYKSKRLIACLIGLWLLTAVGVQVPADDLPYTRTSDVIYGRKAGVSLTMDVFQPKEKANGSAILWIVTDSWMSDVQLISPPLFSDYLGRGYTVFAVVHSSVPA